MRPTGEAKAPTADGPVIQFFGIHDPEALGRAYAGLVRREKLKHLRIVAGVPDDADVDLSLVKLPADALIFPSAYHGAIYLTKPRDGHSLSTLFGQKSTKLGSANRFH